MGGTLINKGNIIFDLDGTLADANHRLRYIKDGAKDWDGFFTACVNDSPIVDNILLSQALYENYDIVIITGRSDAVWDETVTWLQKNDIAYDRLIMRRQGDHTPDYKLKLMLAEQYEITPKNTQCVFDDRTGVVKAWRAAGFTCHQVCEGDY